ARRWRKRRQRTHPPATAARSWTWGACLEEETINSKLDRLATFYELPPSATKQMPAEIAASSQVWFQSHNRSNRYRLAQSHSSGPCRPAGGEHHRASGHGPPPRSKTTGRVWPTTPAT